MQRCRFSHWSEKILWKRKQQPIPVFLLGNLMDRRVWWAIVHGVAKESDMTQELNSNSNDNILGWPKGLLIINFSPISWLQQCLVIFSSVQLLSRVQLFATPWTAAHQASLSKTNSWSLLRLMSIESVMPSNHLILCHPLLLPTTIFPALGSFPLSPFFLSGGQNIKVSISASVLTMNIQD